MPRQGEDGSDMVPKMVFTSYAATTGARCIVAANGSEGEGEKGCRLPLPGAHNVPRGVFRPAIASGATAKMDLHGARWESLLCMFPWRRPQIRPLAGVPASLVTPTLCSTGEDLQSSQGQRAVSAEASIGKGAGILRIGVCQNHVSMSKDESMRIAAGAIRKAAAEGAKM